MKKKRITQISLVVVCVMLLSLLGSGTSVAEEPVPEQGPIATVTIDAGVISWEPQVENGGLVLTVSGPDDFYLRQEYPSGARPAFKPEDSAGNPLLDGVYKYELRFLPVMGEAPSGYSESQRGIVPMKGAGKAPVQSASFSILNGAFVTQDLAEIAADRRFARLLSPDVLHYDDVIITGSLCVGFDCINGESFGYCTEKLKENNLQICFEDTSVGTFPTNDWKIQINDTTSGGASYFTIWDADGGRRPFTIEAGAPAHSLYVEDYGRVGLGTSIPYVELHIVDGDSPTVRLDQDGSGGWTAQRWDLCGNETNFFIRDVTNGSKLSFRIQPNAPSNTLCLKSDGKVGIGTWSPAANLHIEGSGSGTTQVTAQSGSGSDDWISFFANPTYGPAIHWEGSSSNDLRFGPSTGISGAGFSEKMRITGAGNVGIGRTPTTNKLEVEGNASKATAGNWLANSDIRIKKDIQDVESALEVVNELHPVKFRYTDEYRAKHPTIEDRYYYNFIAQEYQEVFPESVQEGWDGYLEVDTYNVTPYLVAAVQELSKQNEELEERVAALEALVISLIQGQTE